MQHNEKKSICEAIIFPAVLMQSIIDPTSAFCIFLLKTSYITFFCNEITKMVFKIYWGQTRNNTINSFRGIHVF